jgi:predicted CopG family antitoxin
MAGPSLPPVIEAAILDRLRAMGRPGESYSDVILRLVEMKAASTCAP